MTEAITITLIIVAGLVGLVWVVLHFAYKAWSAERADARAEDLRLEAVTPVKQSPVDVHIIADGDIATRSSRIADEHLAQFPFSNN